MMNNYSNNYDPPEEFIRRRKRGSGLAYFAVGLMGAIIGGFIMAVLAPVYLYGKYTPVPNSTGGDTAQQIVINTTEDINVAGAVAKKVMPTVVGISTVTVQRDIFFGARYTEGVGSGVIVDPRGYILTNSHVVGDSRTKLTVSLADGRELEGNVLWQDAGLDLAVVKVQANNLPTAELGDSDLLTVGEVAIAIGNPLGLRYERTVTQGIVSGLNRSIMVDQNTIMEDLIQTDAAINPGNSGGPLINSKGQIIGINTVKASAEGLGFAIPINVTKPIIKHFVEDGVFNPPYLGIYTLDREIVGYYDTDIEIKSGLYIHRIIKGSAAESAGLREGDIITHIDNVEVNTMLKLRSVLYYKKPGDTVDIRYQRNGKEYETEAVLQGK
ncbi:S1C family serine protease [Lutispora thermophila]|uniref:Serine protease, S1-C subfamily, contains C-terminal PDZ domain n=1 Tax=Lutispora thermophila DSM 19022 TaxID=1122184 RepID=A0A1M6GW16_9FIRM|nr:trypsin-like peptidase domain-containing protein [Lutispora thermophila]SHJ14143.1 serine protease, S1-C subfamily, contains C-terminal PDZ domain [Lutispora thermophila DSM 19022]